VRITPHPFQFEAAAPTANSLFRNILQISHLNSKIWPVFPLYVMLVASSKLNRLNEASSPKTLLPRHLKCVARLVVRDLKTEKVVDCGNRNRVIGLDPYPSA